jgi:tetratricopeptide (TPR) repeat protein
MDILKEAQQAFRNRDFPKAKTLLTQALENDPENSILLMRLGQVHMALGNFEESLDALRKSQKQDPHNPDVYRSIGMSIRMSGLIDLGISYLGIMLTYAPLVLQSQIHLTLAELFAAKGDRESLRSSLLLLEKIPSNNPRMVLRLWKEILDTNGMKRLAARAPEIHDLAMGIALENTSPQEAEAFLSASTCTTFWEADLALFRLRSTRIYLENALKKAPKTAEILVEQAILDQADSSQQEILYRISGSPVVFASVRQQAKENIH